MEFKVGDRVIAINNYGDYPVKHLHGTVVLINSPTCIGVEFDEKFAGGHNLDGKSKPNQCLWVNSTALDFETNQKGETNMATLYRVYKTVPNQDGSYKIDEKLVVADSEEAAKIKTGFLTPVLGEDADTVTITVTSINSSTKGPKKQ